MSHGTNDAAETTCMSSSTVPEIAANGQRSVAGSMADNLEETELTKKPKTLAASPVG